jgi:uncharacterized short protein YbdD (DUF466 family)
MQHQLISAKESLHKLWWWLRQITGDAAYENYLEHCRATAQGSESQSDTAPAMTRAQFYTDSIRRKYSGISRCC